MPWRQRRREKTSAETPVTANGNTRVRGPLVLSCRGKTAVQPAPGNSIAQADKVRAIATTRGEQEMRVAVGCRIGVDWIAAGVLDQKRR